MAAPGSVVNDCAIVEPSFSAFLSSSRRPENKTTDLFVISTGLHYLCMKARALSFTYKGNVNRAQYKTNCFISPFTTLQTIKKSENMQLNLPPFDVRMGGTPTQPTIFDILRRKYVALTPEEWVRQHFIHYLIESKGYPASLLANEVKLKIGSKTLRADSVLYSTQLSPRMIVEYKAPHIKITQQTFDQIFAYNLLLKADYLVVSNGLSHYCCKLDSDSQKYVFFEDIPNYENL